MGFSTWRKTKRVLLALLHYPKKEIPLGFVLNTCQFKRSGILHRASYCSILIVILFGFSIGDIILCTRIAHRPFSSLTAGRKKASRDL